VSQVERREKREIRGALALWRSKRPDGREFELTAYGAQERHRFPPLTTGKQTLFLR